MRFSLISRYSLGLIFIFSILVSACGSYQNSSYYSDGIYTNDNIIVVKRKNAKAKKNAYSQYFDEKAKQYNWTDQNNNNVVLTSVDSLNQGSLKSYQSNPNWGGGNKTTQIIIQTNPFPLAYGAWGYGGFFDPYFANWNFGYYNPYAWNRFGWGFNRPWRYNRWGWGFYDPFFSPFDPYFGNAFYFGNPYFYGGGYWNGYAYHNRFDRFGRPDRYNRSSQREDLRSNRAVNSSGYRGQAASSGNQANGVAANRTARLRESGQPTNNTNSSRSRLDADDVASNANPVARGRTAAVRNRQNVNDSESRIRRQQAAEEARNRTQIDQVIRSLQNRGYNVEIINNTDRARQFYRENQSRAVMNRTNSSNSNAATKGTPSSRRSSTSNNEQNYSRSSSNRSSSNNFRSSSSRAYSPPARVSSGSSGRSRSSSSSGGRSSGGRRQ